MTILKVQIVLSWVIIIKLFWHRFFEFSAWVHPIFNATGYKLQINYLLTYYVFVHALLNLI